MDITHQVLDIEAYEARQQLPTLILERGAAEHWLVRNKPVGVVEKPSTDWSMTDSGGFVRIPLFPYIANGSHPSTAVAYAMEVALQCLTMVGSDRVKRIHLVIGDPVQQVTLPGETTPVLRFWVGFAFSVR